MKNLEKLIIDNEYSTLKKILLTYESDEIKIRSLLNPLIDKYGLFILHLLLEIAYQRNLSFWFNQIGYYLSFSLSHVNGAERMSLAMFKKSFEIEPNILILKAILDFRYPPEIVLTDVEYNYYSKLFEGF